MSAFKATQWTSTVYCNINYYCKIVQSYLTIFLGLTRGGSCPVRTALNADYSLYKVWYLLFHPVLAFTCVYMHMYIHIDIYTYVDVGKKSFVSSHPPSPYEENLILNFLCSLHICFLDFPPLSSILFPPSSIKSFEGSHREAALSISVSKGYNFHFRNSL